MNSFKMMAIGVFMLVSISAKAQVSVNVQIGTPPPWGPIKYTNERYYYLPDVESYYDVNSSMFIYNNNGVWVRRTYLPRQYRTYDLYSGPKVVIRDYRGETPYTSFNDYRVKYAKGYRGGEVRTIGVRPVIINSKIKKTNNIRVQRNVVKSKGGGNGKSHGKGNGKK